MKTKIIIVIMAAAGLSACAGGGWKSYNCEDGSILQANLGSKTAEWSLSRNSGKGHGIMTMVPIPKINDGLYQKGFSSIRVKENGDIELNVVIIEPMRIATICKANK
jgi:hypothetical protein